MKTQLEKKLEKLPHKVIDFEIDYFLNITKIQNDSKSEEFLWCIEYTDYINENNLITIIHKSLQACIDNTLKLLKNY